MKSEAPSTKIIEKSTSMHSLLESRFDLKLDTSSSEHLKSVIEHYVGKRNHLLLTLGEAGALQSKDYAKAVMISEAARTILREIMPVNRRRKRKTPKDKS